MKTRTPRMAMIALSARPWRQGDLFEIRVKKPRDQYKLFGNALYMYIYVCINNYIYILSNIYIYRVICTFRFGRTKYEMGIESTPRIYCICSAHIYIYYNVYVCNAWDRPKRGNVHQE
jgi:hypothetical protein